MPRPRSKKATRTAQSDWYKDAIIYEVHVRGFKDSSGDGMGDFQGLTEKLDYIQNLGVTAIWLLPFCPSPWRDDGYDISDYNDIHPTYGTLKDFRKFLDEAHARDLKIISELVLNHTSDQHAWFQRARRAPRGSKWRDFYVWSDTPEKYREARIIFKDFEASNWTWDSVAQAYYWHRFYSHQPDLNFDNPAVRSAVLKAVDFWFDMGVDGLRLDAVPYLYEREGTDCENLPETHEFLRTLRAHIESKYQAKLLLAEANQWPEDAIAYLGKGDECHMAFHFPLMPRLFLATRMEDRFPVIDILEQTPPIPDSCQWATFLRNHDELTLEMVTDEERDYMYRAYAQDPQMRINLGIRRRLAPLLGNHRRHIELLNGLLFTLPGTPVIYYGDEFGMGDNIYLGDRNGVRTPMQWSPDRNAGFSSTNPQRLYLPVIIDPEYHFEAVNVEMQEKNPNSLLWWMKRLIAMRKQSKALSRGTVTFLHPSNRRVLAFLREHGEERVLVVANLSRFSQPAELHLPSADGLVPFDMFGRVAFPAIKDGNYTLSVAPLGLQIFSLEPAVSAESLRTAKSAEDLPEIRLPALDDIAAAESRKALERILPAYMRNRRWFRSKARTIRSTHVREMVAVTSGSSWLALVDVEYTEGESETYVLPVSLSTGLTKEQIRDRVDAALAWVHTSAGEKGLLFSALQDDRFRAKLLESVAQRKRVNTSSGSVQANSTRKLRSLLDGRIPGSRVQGAEQSNSSIIYGDAMILKLFRRLESGLNPDVEICRMLTEKAEFPHVPPTYGGIEFQPAEGEPMSLGILQGFVVNEGDAWQMTLHVLGQFLERALADGEVVPHVGAHPLSLLDGEPPQIALDLIQKYLDDAKLLGRRTGELHLALARPTDDSAFKPEPFTDFYRNGLYHGMVGLLNQSFQTLRTKLRSVQGAAKQEASAVLDLESRVRQQFRPIRDFRITGLRTRIHGDYHLGQVLFTGKDFVIIDFEGEPARPLGERRIKRSPLRDVAGMLRSFHYASAATLIGKVPGIFPDVTSLPRLQEWATLWYVSVSGAFMKGYLEATEGSQVLPRTRDELYVLINAYLMEKAVYELNYELNNRPEWVRIPLLGILGLLEHPVTPAS